MKMKNIQKWPFLYLKYVKCDDSREIQLFINRQLVTNAINGFSKITSVFFLVCIEIENLIKQNDFDIIFCGLFLVIAVTAQTKLS